MTNGSPNKEAKMLRAIVIAALLVASDAAFSQELTAKQRNACMGDYEKYCKGTEPGGGRILPFQIERQAHAGMQEGAGRRG
jgi:hypothetical protein